MDIVSSDGKQQFYKLDTLRFTIFEDKTAEYTMQWNDTTLGWRSLQPYPDIYIEIINAQGGILDKWDLGPHFFQCLPAHPVVYQRPGIVGVLDLAFQITMTIGAGTWTQCH
jgi:hypothetical protein